MTKIIGARAAVNSLYALVAASLVACGGSGDSGTGTSSPAPAPAPLPSPAPPPTQDSRTWSKGVLLEQSSKELLDYADRPGFSAGLADDGTGTIAFAQIDATGRYAVHVVRSLPGSASGQPEWGSPEIIDASAPMDRYSERPLVAVAPGGNAVVMWVIETKCTADGYAPTAPDCTEIYASRRLSSSSSWEKPVRVKDTPYRNAGLGRAVPLINDRGDIAILFPGPKTPSALATGVNAYDLGFALRSATDSAFRVGSFSAVQLFNIQRLGSHVLAGMDADGRITVAGENRNGQGANDIVVVRGTVAAGFGTNPQAVPLDNYAAPPEIFGLKVGLDGTVAVAYRQDIPTRKRATVVAVLAPGVTAWSTSDVTVEVGTLSTPDALDILEPPVDWAMRVPDTANGDVLIYRECAVTRRTTGQWTAAVPLPGPCYWGQNDQRSSFAMDRNGSFVFMDANGRWSAYDAGKNVFTKALTTLVGDAPNTDYVLGVPKDPRNGNGITQFLLKDTGQVSALSPRGHALMVVRSSYAALPSTDAPLGDAGKLDNLFGFYYR